MLLRFLERLAACGLLIAVAAAAAPAPVAAQAPARIRISQAVILDRTLRLYVETRSDSGQHVAVSREALTVTHANQPLTIANVTPFRLTGEGIAYVVLVDLSQSVTAEFDVLRRNLLRVVERLGDADRMSILPFGSDAPAPTPFTADKGQLRAKLESLKAVDAKTHLYDALERAIDHSRAAFANVPNRRVLLIASDGIDDGSRATKDDIVRRLGEHRVPIFALGRATGPDVKSAQLDVLRSFAHISGGVYRTGTATDIEKNWGELQAAARDVTVVDLTCRNCPTDGTAYPLRVRMAAGGGALEDEIPMRGDWPPRAGIPKLYLALGGAAVIILAGALIWVTQRQRRAVRHAREWQPRPQDVLGRSPDEITVPPDRIMVKQGGTRYATPVHTPPVAPPVSLPSVALRFVIVYGSQPGKALDARLQQSRPLTVGRAPGCDLVIAGDPRVEERHFELTLSDGQTIVVRNLSQNGTMVDGIVLRSAMTVGDGTLIKAGATEMRLVVTR